MIQNHLSHSDYHDFICNNHLPLKRTKTNHSEYVNEEISSSKRKKTENKNQMPLTQLPSEQDTVKHDKTSEMSSEQTNVFDQCTFGDSIFAPKDLNILEKGNTINDDRRNVMCLNNKIFHTSIVLKTLCQCLIM